MLALGRFASADYNRRDGKLSALQPSSSPRDVQRQQPEAELAQSPRDCMRANGRDRVSLFEEPIFDTVSEAGDIPASEGNSQAEYVDRGETSDDSDDSERARLDNKQEDSEVVKGAKEAGVPGDNEEVGSSSRAISTLPVTRDLLEIFDNVDPVNELLVHIGRLCPKEERIKRPGSRLSVG